MKRSTRHDDAAPANQLAFTLVEALIVLTIISLIAAVILPVFASVRERGRQSACLSNMHQISLAVAQYVADGNGVYPSGGPADPEWTSQVSPYLKSVDVFRCPSDPTEPPSSIPGGFVQSYAINANLLALFVFGVPTVPDATLLSSSRTVMLFEVSNAVDSFTPGQLGGAAGNGTTACSDGLGGSFPCGVAAVEVTIHGRPESQPLYATGNIGGRGLNGDYDSTPRHSGGANYVACDGHAKWLRPAEVSSGSIAAFPYCSQGGTAGPPPECIRNRGWRFTAAGTSLPKYQLTFSTR